MVKKLMKYELASYMRSLLPFQLILLGIALLHRFVQLFENDGDAYWTFFFILYRHIHNSLHRYPCRDRCTLHRAIL